ncbi:hypothetical protein QR98_0037850 [Sarcoptes scabiei]|uniref:Uncharacterized protein n=1 Tax=Sarcoptes scabiei TaxID=52283 RepID=A0A132A325_SARSC|nr:hypothetical protein QR98_0037850 [Sarcoptes scabiei]
MNSNNFKADIIKINPAITKKDLQAILDVLNHANQNIGKSRDLRCNQAEQKCSKGIKRTQIILEDDQNDFVENRLLEKNCDQYLKNKDKLVFQVIYGKYKPYKKNKEWNFDGFITLKCGQISLLDCSGKM